MMALFRRRRSRWAGVDFLTLKPRRCLEYRCDGEGDRTVLLVPRFRSGILGRCLQPRLDPDRAHIKVRLERRGSWIWEQCDGQRTVAEIVEGFLTRFPEESEQADQRVCQYLYTMESNRLIHFTNFPATT
jgi:hypothetical protein